MIVEGDFSDKYEGQTIKLSTSHSVTSNVDTYKIYLWIDGENYNNPVSMQNQSFLFKINVNAVDGTTCSPSRAGTTIATGDILAYWVWIPRYRYELFNAGYTELSGFWVAKFEPSEGATAGNLTVLPGAASLRNQTVAINMIRENADINTIMKFTGLSKNEIMALK